GPAEGRSLLSRKEHCSGPARIAMFGNGSLKTTESMESYRCQQEHSPLIRTSNPICSCFAVTGRLNGLGSVSFMAFPVLKNDLPQTVNCLAMSREDFVWARRRRISGKRRSEIWHFGNGNWLPNHLA